MKKRFLLAQAVALALFAGAPAALAADYEPTIIPADTGPVDEYKPVEIGTGWYIRGDIGYSISASSGADPYRTYFGGAYGSHAWDMARIDSDWSASIGFGYRFNDWLRTDFTADRFTGTFTGKTSDPFSCAGPADTTTGCASNDRASFTAYSLMANAYADLGTVVGITPYVGAGAGVTFMNWGDLTNSVYCVNGTATCSSSAVTSVTHTGINSARFTWALMAGASYDVTDNLKFDLGYRYRKISGGDMFQFDSASQSAGATGAQGRDKGLSSHEIRVGLRYELW